MVGDGSSSFTAEIVVAEWKGKETLFVGTDDGKLLILDPADLTWESVEGY